MPAGKQPNHMNRYVLRSEFVPNSAALEWWIIDTATNLKVATVYAFDGTAQAIVDMLNERKP